MRIHSANLQNARSISYISLVICLLLILATPFITMSGELNEGQKNYRVYLYFILAALQLSAAFLRGWSNSLKLISGPVLIFISWCALSLLWTHHIDLTFKRLFLFFLLYVTLITCIFDIGPRAYLSIIRIILFTSLLLSFYAALALPQIGTHFGSLYLWRGLMAHKNIAGILCAMIVIMFTFDCQKVPIAGRAIAILMAVIFLYMSWAKTALITLPIALAAGGAVVLVGSQANFQIERWRKSALIGSTSLYAFTIFALIFATIERDFFLSLTDNTSALTGRGAAWRPMIQFYLESPVLGAGYGAYWDASPTILDDQSKNSHLWKHVDQGHNGYLDLLVQVGLPGLSIAIYAAFINPIINIISIANRNSQKAALALSIIVLTLIQNFTESNIFSDDTLGNGFLIISLSYLQHSVKFYNLRSKTNPSDQISRAVHLRNIRRIK